MLVVMFTTMLSANAQVATENSKLFDNTYVGVEAGVTTPLNFNSTFPLNTVVGVKLGKELTPVFGIELEGVAGFGDNVYNYGYNSSTQAGWEGAYNLHKNGHSNTFVKTTNVGLNGVINWSNLLFGYNGTPRVFEVKTNTGIGWMHYFGRPNMVGVNLPVHRNALTAKTAIDLNLKYEFNGEEQDSKAKVFDNTFKDILKIKVKASSGEVLELEDVDFIWNSEPLKAPKFDTRGQKGAIVEMYGWKDVDIEKECEFIGEQGYMGVKVS